MDDDLPPETDPADPLPEGLLEALPGLARIAAASSWRTLEWMVGESVATSDRLIRAVAAGESPMPVIRDATTEVRTMARKTFGLSDLNDEPGSSGDTGATAAELRRRGADLLYRSADVRFAEDTHPAYERILGELAPDEGRILRFLALEGPQPAVDVRTSRPLGIGSELVASGLSMIGLQSGVRKLDRTKAYLNNLFRLGLIWFSRETVETDRYQVVEVQPAVTDAMKKAGRAPKTVRRSIHLTPFGEDFCDTCLPLDYPDSANPDPGIVLPDDPR